MPINTLRYISSDVSTSAITSAHKYSPSNPRELDIKGELHGLITVIGEDGVYADRITKFVWDSIVDTYYYLPFSSIIDQLKRAVSEGSKQALELIKNDKDTDGKGINLSFSLAVFKGKTAYLTVFGEQQMFLYKNGGFVKVSDIVTQNRGVVASLAWSDTDLLLMSSPNLLDTLVESVQIGDSVAEIVKSISFGKEDLSGYQSVLLISNQRLSDFEYVVSSHKEQVKEVIKENDDLPVVENSSVDEVEEITDVQDSPLVQELQEGNALEKSSRFKQVQDSLSILWRKSLNVLKRVQKDFLPFVTKIGAVVNKGVTYIGAFFSKMIESVKAKVWDKYGRQNWYRRIVSKFSTLGFSKKSGAFGMKIDGYKEVNLRNKRFGMVVVGILGILVIFGAVRLSINAKEARDMHKYASTILISASKNINEIDKLVLSDTDSATLKIATTKQDLFILEGKKLGIDDGIKYRELKEKLTALDDRLSKRIGLSAQAGNIDLFIDGRALFGDTTNLTDITTYKDDFQNEFLLVVDEGNKVAYKIGLSDRKVERISDSNNLLADPKYIDYGSGGIYIYDNKSGVVKSAFGKNGKLGNLTVANGLDKDIIGDLNVRDISVLGSVDNLFFLVPDQKAIFKSALVGSGYGLPYEYTTSNTFSTAKNLANESNIYVMTAGGTGLERYSYSSSKAKHTLNPVTITGLDSDMENITAAYTGFTPTSEMFVFDSAQNRLVEFEKPIESGADARHPNEMVLLNQYVYRGDREDVFKDVREIASDYNDSFVYVLDGNKVWKVSVK